MMSSYEGFVLWVDRCVTSMFGARYDMYEIPDDALYASVGVTGDPDCLTQGQCAQMGAGVVAALYWSDALSDDGEGGMKVNMRAYGVQAMVARYQRHGLMMAVQLGLSLLRNWNIRQQGVDSSAARWLGSILEAWGDWQATADAEGSLWRPDEPWGREILFTQACDYLESRGLDCSGVRIGGGADGVRAYARRQAPAWPALLDQWMYADPMRAVAAIQEERIEQRVLDSAKRFLGFLLHRRDEAMRTGLVTYPESLNVLIATLVSRCAQLMYSVKHATRIGLSPDEGVLDASDDAGALLHDPSSAIQSPGTGISIDDLQRDFNDLLMGFKPDHAPSEHVFRAVFTMCRYASVRDRAGLMAVANALTIVERQAAALLIDDIGHSAALDDYDEVRRFLLAAIMDQVAQACRLLVDAWCNAQEIPEFKQYHADDEDVENVEDDGADDGAES